MSASARVAAIVAACVATLAAGCGSSSKPVATTPGQSASSVATAAPPAAGSTQAATPTSPTTPSGGATTPTSGTGGTPAGPAGAGSRTRSCGTVPFAAASSHGAFEILATGVSCSTAQAVAAAARSCFGCGYAAQGFRCAGREVTTGLLRVNYTCTQGSSKVTFVRA